MTHVSTAPGLRELAVREADGVEVTLLWDARSDVPSVRVVDSRSREAFELVLDRDDPPLDVFHHPYAYAARRGLDLGRSSPEHELAVA